MKQDAIKIVEGMEAEQDRNDDLEIQSPELSAEVYRNYYDKKKKENPEEIYPQLNRRSKMVVNNMISYLLPEKYSKLYVRDYYFKLKKYLENQGYLEKESNYKIAQMYCVILNCEAIKNDSGDETNEATVQKIIQRLEKSASLKENSNSTKYFRAFCNMFSIDEDVLENGFGYIIKLNEEEIEKKLNERNRNLDVFIAEALNRTCNKCPHRAECGYCHEYIKTLKYNIKELAENMAELLGVSLESIIINIPIRLFEEDNLSLEKYKEKYMMLSKNNQNTINELVRNLYFTQYTLPIYGESVQ